ncbi:MAG: tyrosine-type recombinase/integrase, partial [Chloroflexi bacterium]|nr:tyrosine-type recombinase/integrase [Chloroflexota bacterium]
MAFVGTGGLAPNAIPDLRHTAATLLLAAGTHAKVVQEMLGHSSIALILDTYSRTPTAGHLQPDTYSRT